MRIKSLLLTTALTAFMTAPASSPQTGGPGLYPGGSGLPSLSLTHTGTQNSAPLYASPSSGHRNVAPSHAADGSADIMGVVTDGLERGYYGFSLTSPEGVSPLFTSDKLAPGSFMADGKIYSPYFTQVSYVKTTNELYVIDAATGQASQPIDISMDWMEVRTSVYVPSMGSALCYAEDDGPTKALMSLRPDGTMTKLADLDKDHRPAGGMAISPAGTVYAMTASGTLYTIDTSDYSFTLVGETGCVSSEYSAMVYDEASSKLYCASYADGVSSLYSVDPATAGATKLYDFTDKVRFGMLYTPEVLRNPKVPAAATDLKVNFADGSLSGTVSFLPPATTADGKTASGDISYVLKVNNEDYATGNTSFGAGTVTLDMTIPRGALYNLAVVCSNGEGEGKPLYASQYIGPSAPKPVLNVTLTRDGETMNLEWDAAMAENEDYYFDEEAVAYEVTRMVNEQPTVVAENLSATEFTEEYPEPASGFEKVYYTVKAKYLGNEAKASASKKVLCGIPEPPYFEDFSTDDAMVLYTILDHNDDQATWGYNKREKAMACEMGDDGVSDDYLILPVRLKRGYYYEFSFVAGCEYKRMNTNSVALYVGTEPTFEGLTTELIAPTAVDQNFGHDSEGNATGIPFSANFTADKSGIYYVAIKDCTNEDGAWYGLKVSDIRLSPGTSQHSPAAPTDLVLASDEYGDPMVDITFKAPVKDIAGDALESISKIVIYRGDTEIATLDKDLTPGAEYTVTDNDSGTGLVTYEVFCFNEQGQGLSATGEVHVGIDLPVVPENLCAAPGADYGELVFTWPEVTKDIHGHTLDGNVSYSLYRFNKREYSLIEADIVENTYTYRANSADTDPYFETFAIAASTEAGEGEKFQPEPVYIGKPYVTPFFDSAAGTAIFYNTVLNGYCYGWTTATDAQLGIESQDGDGIYYAMASQEKDDCSRLTTGKIHIDENMKEPALVFYYFSLGEACKDELTAQVRVGDTYTDLGSEVCGNGDPYRWNRLSYDLSAYKGQDIQLGFMGTTSTNTALPVDNIQIIEKISHDLGVTAKVPADVEIGKTLTVTALVDNRGFADEGDYTVDLLINGEVAETKSSKSLENPVLKAGSNIDYLFEYPVGITLGNDFTVQVRVTCAGDVDPDNDLSAESAVHVRYLGYPAVTDLAGTAREDGGADLSWSAPAIEGFTTRRTDDFENCTSFANMNEGHTAGWKLVDADGKPSGSFKQLDIPGMNRGDAASFFVLDNAHADFNETFDAHSGTKSLAAMYTEASGTSDNWAISPELCGGAQTISFFARSYLPSTLETVEVLYSTEGTDIESFVSVKTIEKIGTTPERGWNCYEFSVPAGAKHFALRHVSSEFLLMIDDVTYSPATGTKPVEFKGYNVYRNGVKLNDAPVAATTFTDPEHVDLAGYVVTAVYADGESAPSNVAYPHGTGSVDGITGMMNVKSLAGEIVVSGAPAGICVADMQGRVIYMSAGSEARIPAATGIYIVRSGREVRKIMVK